MSSKKRNLRSTQVPAEKTAPLVPHSEERGAGWIEVVIRSESIRMEGNVALEESPALLGVGSRTNTSCIIGQHC